MCARSPTLLAAGPKAGGRSVVRADDCHGRQRALRLGALQQVLRPLTMRPDTTRQRVEYQLAALRDLLDVWMRRTIPGQRAIVRVDGVGYY